MIGDLFDSPWKIAIIAVLIIVLFGARKLPDAARSLGKSMRILKTEMQSMHDDDEPAQPAAVQAPVVAPAPIQSAAPPAPATPPADAQAQLAALQEHINSLQQSVGANGTAADSQQKR